jgi:hypothetical protein
MSAWRERERERGPGGAGLVLGFRGLFALLKGLALCLDGHGLQSSIVSRATPCVRRPRCEGARELRSGRGHGRDRGRQFRCARRGARRRAGRRLAPTAHLVVGHGEGLARTRAEVLKLSGGLHARSAWAGRESAGAAAEQATDADGCTALSGRGRRAVGVEQWLLLGAVRR